jgi:TRAP transporter 4TM/12TM fusion protein
VADTHEAGPAGPRSLAARGLITALSVLVTLASLGWAADFYRIAFEAVFATEQFLAAILAFALPLLFLSFRASPRLPKDRVPWYDWVLAAAGFVCGVYMAIYYTQLSELVADAPLDGTIAAIVLVVVVIEGLRRTTGWALFIIVLVFLLYTQVADLVPGQLQGLPSEPARTIYYVAWDNGSMLGLPMAVACTIVIAFIFFGSLLSLSGGSAFFTDLAVALMGRFRGGSAKIAVVASGLFGSISGSAVSNVVSTGVITIPLMRKGGYDAKVAAAVEAVASTGGQLMPPIMGAAAFLMATFLEVTYAEVVVAALLPAILYYVALFIQVDLEAARAGIKRVDEALIPRAGRVLRQGWHYALAFTVLIVSLFWLNLQPETAALYAAITIIVTGALFGYGGRRMPLSAVWEALKNTGVASVDILMICAAAGIIIGVLNLSGLGHALAQFLVDVAGGNLFLLLTFAAIVCIILGMGMPTAGVYVLLATLVAPSIIKAGVEPMAAHLYVMYFGMMSMITPPVAIAAFTAASLAGTNAMATGLASVRFGWIAYIVPFLFVLSPSLLLEGPVVPVIIAIATAIAGVWLICGAVTGYLLRPMDPLLRVLTAIAGFGLLFPANALPYGSWVDLGGLVLGILIVGREYLARRGDVERASVSKPAPIDDPAVAAGSPRPD